MFKEGPQRGSHEAVIETWKRFKVNEHSGELEVDSIYLLYRLAVCGEFSFEHSVLGL